MSLIPAFDIGVWNAWIFMVCSLIPIFFIPLVSRGREEGASFTVYFSKIQKSALLTLHLIYMLLVIYSIFVPLKLGTVWFYVGLLILVIGLAMQVMTTLSVAKTPLDKPATQGPYRISRHPMYFGGFLGFIGISTACISWIYLLLAIVWMIPQHILVVSEERFCLKKYGDAYREYMNRTPRWIGIPRSSKILNKLPPSS